MGINKHVMLRYSVLVRMYVFCFYLHRGILSLIDWKTSSKPRPLLKDMYDGPIQVAAYIGALNQDGRYPFIVSHLEVVLSRVQIVCSCYVFSFIV